MSKPKFDQAFWDTLWTKTLREHGDKVAHRPPNAHLTAEIANLPPGRALDAGCGHGADTLWLAALGWHVTALERPHRRLGSGHGGADGERRRAGRYPIPESPLPQQIRSKSLSKQRSQRSIPRCGSWSSQPSVCAPSPAPVSTQ